MMKSFWPTPQAKQMFPAVAEHMNKVNKAVFENARNSHLAQHQANQGRHSRSRAGNEKPKPPRPLEASAWGRIKN